MSGIYVSDMSSVTLSVGALEYGSTPWVDVFCTSNALMTLETTTDIEQLLSLLTLVLHGIRRPTRPLEMPHR